MTGYSLSVDGRFVDSKQGSLLNYNIQIKDSYQLKFSISAVNILGSGHSCEVLKTIPTSE